MLTTQSRNVAWLKVGLRLGSDHGLLPGFKSVGPHVQENLAKAEEFTKVFRETMAKELEEAMKKKGPGGR